MINTHKEQKNDQVASAVREQVAAAFRDILSDPDRGLLLRNDAANRLKKSIKSIKSAKGGRTKNLKSILKKHDI